MAIRFTVSYSGYVAQNLTGKTNTFRVLHDVFVRPRVFQHPDRDPRSSHRTVPSVSSYATVASELLGIETSSISCSKPSPLVVGLIHLIKSTAVGGGGGSTGSGGSGVFGISPLKASAVIPFFNGSKWLPCNEINSSEVDKGGTSKMVMDDKDKEEKKVVSESVKRCEVVVKSGWFNKVLNVCSDDAKAAFTALSVRILFSSQLAAFLRRL